VADSYDPPRALIGEVWLADSERFANYLRPDEMHTAFNFDFLGCPWDAKALRKCVDDTLVLHAPVDAPSTWVLSNHDVTRHVTRYGRADTAFEFALRGARHAAPTDPSLGLRRARAAALLTMSLPGSVYVYQGEELGLPEVEDLPDSVRDDPMFTRSAGSDPGRDGCRVPLPWSSSGSALGFSPAGAAAPWLPQPADWAALTVEAQAADPESMLSLYRAGLRLRRSFDGPMTWLDAGDDVLAFRRTGRASSGCAEQGASSGCAEQSASSGCAEQSASSGCAEQSASSGCAEQSGPEGTRPPVAAICVVNLSSAPVELPAGEVLLASGALAEGRLPSDTAVWLLESGA
jgi:alpha-glucosidase